MKLIYEMNETEAKDLLEKISAVLGIGSAVRNGMTIMTNIENASRRSDCLSLIEEYHSVTKLDEDEEEYTESLLNWGEDPEKYIETYKQVYEKLHNENLILRKLLWLNHGCYALYGDDGEMQCGQCIMDFKRDSIERIEEQLEARRRKA